MQPEPDPVDRIAAAGLRRLGELARRHPIQPNRAITGRLGEPDIEGQEPGVLGFGERQVRRAASRKSMSVVLVQDGQQQRAIDPNGLHPQLIDLADGPDDLFGRHRVPPDEHTRELNPEAVWNQDAMANDIRTDKERPKHRPKEAVMHFE